MNKFIERWAGIFYDTVSSWGSAYCFKCKKRCGTWDLLINNELNLICRWCKDE